MVLIATLWEASNMAARLGSVSSGEHETKLSSRGARKSSQNQNRAGERERDLRWKLDDLSLAAICHADDVVLVAKSMDTVSWDGSASFTIACRMAHANKCLGMWLIR